MSKYVPADKETANRYRTARGFSSFQEWSRQNREAEKNFRSRMNIPSEDKERLEALIETLEADRARYIAPNL